MRTHPDADAFMRAYLEQPADATARLVFADWLEETGEPHSAAWAHFIRHKAEAARHDSSSRERRDLDRRADKYALQIRARLTISAKMFVGYPKSLLQLLPAPNIRVRLDGFEPPRGGLELMPESIARENRVLPLDAQWGTLLIAAVNPRDWDLSQKLTFILNREIILVRAERDDVVSCLDRAYGRDTPDFVEEYLVEFPDAPLFYSMGRAPDESTVDDSPAIVRLVDILFREAIGLRATRILLYPDFDAIGVRYRTESAWVERDRIPIRILRPLTARIAVLGGLDTDRLFADPPMGEPFVSEFFLPDRHDRHVLVRVTIQPSPDGPTTQLDLTFPRH